MNFGIKECKELIVGVDLLAVTSISIAKDGLGADDIAKALELIKKVEVIIEAVKGVDQIDDELKELEGDEIAQLGMATFDMIKNIIAEVKKLKE
jgi:hypothetical protein